MKVLITGGSGLLGKYLIATAPRGYELYPTYHTNPIKSANGVFPEKLDITDEVNAINLMFRLKPDAIIHCAAIGSVDFAQRNDQAARAVNVDGTRYLARMAEKINAKFVYISSNAVYAGDNPPYHEASPLTPVNVYGWLKAEAEEIARKHPDHLIIRPYLLYGWPNPGGRRNWATTILEHYQKEIEQPFYLVDDVLWQPTYAGDCAKAIWQLLTRRNEIINVASQEALTLYHFGVKVCHTWGFDDILLRAARSDHFPGIAPRPQNTGYDLRKLNGLGITLSDCDEGLEAMKNEL